MLRTSFKLLEIFGDCLAGFIAVSRLSFLPSVLPILLHVAASKAKGDFFCWSVDSCAREESIENRRISRVNETSSRVIYTHRHINMGAAEQPENRPVKDR